MPANKIFNKSFVTHLVAVSFICVSYLINNPYYAHIAANIGYYSLTSALTNWIAIYMLFERVPFFYGSGVIETQFESFKKGIKQLVMQEFFTETNIEAVLDQTHIDQEKLLEIADRIDYDIVSQHLIDGLLETKLGNMISLIGGQGIVSLLKEPLKEKLRLAFHDMLTQEKLQKALLEVVSHHHSHFIETIEQIVNHRLEKLTPSMVKDIIQKMIREHLGWLVVWGGVFGGLIGAVLSFISK